MLKIMIEYLRLFLLLLVISVTPSLSIAQSAIRNASKLDRYMMFAHPIGAAKLSFPGSNGGYTLIHLPTKEITEIGDTVIKDHAYLLDLNLSHDGLYLAPDTMLKVTDFTPFEFAITKDHIIHAKLAPSHSHEELRNLDSTFNGTLGYGLLRQFVTVFDFKKNTLTFYPLYANVDIGQHDTNATQLPLIDDAKITYCGCPFPTIWMDVQAPPLKPGHVNLAFDQPLSQVFTPAIDAQTQKLIDKQTAAIHKVTNGTKEKQNVGFNLGQFIVGGENIASRSPHRAIAELPAQYHDLNVAVLGTLGMDVLRTFSGIIIDPSRSKVILVK
jgi:hypothetical protein